MENSPANFSDSNGVELIQTCKKLENVENELNQKNNKPTYRYTKVELLRLKDHPLSLKPPVITASLKSLCGKTASVKDEADLKKDQLKKKSLSRSFEPGKKYDIKDIELTRNREKPTVIFRTDKSNERKATDPTTRIRKEQDICLSPQRKSFNTGCFVQNIKNEAIGNTANATKQNVENSSDNRENNDNRESRESREHREPREMKENRNSREAPRRIGSGRIITSDPQFVIRGYPDARHAPKDKPTVVYKCTFQGKTNDREKENVWNRQKNIGYFDKRKNQYADHSFEEDQKCTVWDHRINNFFERRRQYRNDYHRDDEEEKEPEWMKEGPGSKNDMIELKGFDENVERFFKEGKKKHNVESDKNALNGRESLKRASESDTSSVTSESISGKPSSDLVRNNSSESNQVGVVSVESVEEKNIKAPEGHSIELNLDEIFKEPLLDLNANTETNESVGSKFTRWFRRDDANSNSNTIISTSFNESLQSIISGNSEQNGKVSVPSTSVIASDPIKEKSNIPEHSSNLLDLLRVSQDSSSSSKMDVRVLEATGKLHSLEEIEAKLTGTDRSQGVVSSALDRKRKEEEAEAFKKLLSQALKPEDGSTKQAAINDVRFSTQRERNENGPQFQSKTDLSSLFCNGDAPPNFPPNMLPPQVSRMLPLHNGKQFPLQQGKQEVLSKMFISNSSNFAAPPQPSSMRTANVSMSPGVFSPITPEIQSRINECQLTRELMQRQETLAILKAVKKGDLTVHHLVEQFKKTTPSQIKFRESVICVLKMMQQTPYINSSPFLNSPMGMSFNMPPPSHSPLPPYNENLIQQMIMNSQYRSGLPNIVYQRDFSLQNQNIFQNNVNKKLQSEQTHNVNQSPMRMNSPLTIGVTSLSSVPGTSSMSPSNNSIALSREKKNNAVLSMKSPATSQSHSFTPISVLRQLSADKENMDTVTRDAKETKHANVANLSHSNPTTTFTPSLNTAMSWNATKSISGEKNALVPYTANSSSQCNSVCVNAGVFEHFNSFGSCIPPPAISGQYFVGNMIRPSSLSSSIPIFNNPPPTILSRLPMSSNTNIIAKGSQKLSTTTPSHLHQGQMRGINYITQGHDSFFPSSNRMNSDGIISSPTCGNQNMTTRNSIMNGLLPSGDEQLNRIFLNSSISQSMPLPNSNVPVSVPNIISVEEIERMQQSVRN